MELPKSKFQNLHSDLYMSIFLNAGPFEIDKLCATTKKFHKLCENPELWREKILHDFPDLSMKEVKGFKNPKREYFKLHIKASDHSIITLKKDLKNDPEIKDIERKINELRVQKDSIIENYNERIEQVRENAVMLKTKLHWLNFTPRTTFTKNKRLIKALEYGKLSEMGSVKKLAKYYPEKVYKNEVIIVENGNYPEFFIFIYNKLGNLWYAFSEPPDFPWYFEELLQYLGITMEKLLKLYGLNFEMFEPPDGPSEESE